LVASHELEIARQLATREVRIAAGQMHEASETVPVPPLSPPEAEGKAEAPVQAQAHA
jgi:hypothetical protein